MFCGACGTRNEEGRTTCKKCGANLMSFVVPGSVPPRTAPAPAPMGTGSVPPAAPAPGRFPAPRPAAPQVAPVGYPAPQRPVSPAVVPAAGGFTIPRGPAAQIAANQAPLEKPGTTALDEFEASGGMAGQAFGQHAVPAMTPVTVPGSALGGVAPAPAQPAFPKQAFGQPVPQAPSAVASRSVAPQPPAPANPAVPAPQPVRSTPGIVADAPRSASAPRVVLSREDGTQITISEFPAMVGKGSAANVRIEGNKAISRVHACISFMGTFFAIEDKGSTNGTYINGNVLAAGETVKLHDGDVVTLGNEDFKVKLR